MPRRSLLAPLALALTLPALSAHAASPDPRDSPRARFYIFDGSAFEVGPRLPGIDAFGPRQAARFGRLLELKKDLTPGIGQALKDRTFK